MEKRRKDKEKGKADAGYSVSLKKRKNGSIVAAITLKGIQHEFGISATPAAWIALDDSSFFPLPN
ncbi:MAG: hypothetical protein HZB62_05800 [Nitrospirae bacterium]|nr:hypothetical protein [Nitrospirota bacterium]